VELAASVSVCTALACLARTACAGPPVAHHRSSARGPPTHFSPGVLSCSLRRPCLAPRLPPSRPNFTWLAALAAPAAFGAKWACSPPRCCSLRAPSRPHRMIGPDWPQNAGERSPLSNAMPLASMVPFPFGRRRLCTTALYAPINLAVLTTKTATVSHARTQSRPVSRFASFYSGLLPPASTPISNELPATVPDPASRRSLHPLRAPSALTAHVYEPYRTCLVAPSPSPAPPAA
jgi:hypothetical protein